ncbi:hypothetical protein [uncultured Treponema sp.]|jgi:hypothetical protein|uniref:hypothetical protein n=1 Tax=uncultured Treponema sp. TaxID=162155 RepID=UPI00280B061F|nr:hypothetical protein [uncultured Treponema sp.]
MMMNDFLTAWKALDVAKKGNDWYKAVNRINGLIDKYSKKSNKKSDLEYLKWNEQKLRQLLVAPSLHNGVLEAEIRRIK